MAYKLKVKDKIYDLKDGFTIKEELNETLDSATGIEFETFHEEFNGIPFDHAVIFDDENKITEKHFLIDTYDDEIYSFESDMEQNNHHYFVKLFSETKGLERTTLPNITVTQPTSGTKRSVEYVMDRIELCYFPLYRRYYANDYNYTYARKYQYHHLTKSRFSNIVCPEFQWNNPTLREVLTDLFSVDDCIPVVKKGVISHYDLKEKGTAIDTSKISYSKRTMSSGDFVGELTINMKNAIGKSKTVCCEYIPLKASENSGTLTTENGVIKTLNPIYNIKKLVIYGFCGDNLFHKVDITDHIKEYEDWNTLSAVKISSSKYSDLPSWTDSYGYTSKEHKVNYLYYERGGYEIHNLNKSYRAVLGSFNFMESIVASILMVLQTTSTRSFPKDDDRNVFFYVEYESLCDHPMHVGKYLPSPHPENRVFDAQKDSYVDVQHLSIFEYSKVERLGNKIREIRGEYFNENEIPQLGDYIGDEILFSREITYFDNILVFKGYLIPHYVLKDYYTGVMAKKRSWEIAKGSEALTRHDVYKAYVEASFNEKKESFSKNETLFESISGLESYDNVVEKFVSAITGYNANSNIVHAGILTRVVGEEFPVDNTTWRITLDLLTEVQGNSICFNFGFNDNFKSADYIEKDDGEFVQGFYKYCTKDTGYFQRASIYLVGKTYGLGDTGHEAMPIAREDNPNSPTYSNEFIETTINDQFKRPRQGQTALTYQNSGFKVSTYVLKDNREITKWAIQIEYCSDTPDIILTEKFIEYCSVVHEKASVDERGPLFLAFAPRGFKYSMNDKVANTEVALVGINLSVPGETTTWLRLEQPPSNNKNSIKASWNESSHTANVGRYGAWAVCYYDSVTHDYRILMAVNKSSNVPVYFNLLRSRDTKVYKNSWSQEEIGDISDIEHITPDQ